MRRITGASLNGRRPAQISTSAWRGEKACRSMPKRAKSNRLAAVAMNSMAQHAVPNGIGQSELARDEFTAQSTKSWNLASREFGLCPWTSFVSITRLPAAHPPGSIPVHRPALRDVHVPDGQNEHEHQHFDEQESHARPPGSAGCAPEVNRSPRNKEHRLDVENDEQHGDQVELDRKPLARAAERRHAAFVRAVLDGVGLMGREEMREPDQKGRVERHEAKQEEEGEIGLVHVSS